MASPKESSRPVWPWGSAGMGCQDQWGTVAPVCHARGGPSLWMSSSWMPHTGGGGGSGRAGKAPLRSREGNQSQAGAFLHSPHPAWATKRAEEGKKDRA